MAYIMDIWKKIKLPICDFFSSFYTHQLTMDYVIFALYTQIIIRSRDLRPDPDTVMVRSLGSPATAGWVPNYFGLVPDDRDPVSYPVSRPATIVRKSAATGIGSGTWKMWWPCVSRGLVAGGSVGQGPYWVWSTVIPQLTHNSGFLLICTFL